MRPPYRAIWELTRRCNLGCPVCLVEGGRAGPDELGPSEALAAAEQLADLGVSVVSLTGGEPLLRPDWGDIAERLRLRGLRLRFSANGHGFEAATLARLEELGAECFVVSVDGPREVHDRLRRSRTAFDEAVAALDRLRGSRVQSGAITAVVRQNLDQLPRIYSLLVEHGARQWMVQLAHRTGRLRHPADDGPEPIAPADLPRLASFLVRVGRERRLDLIVHNSIGYLSAEEPLLLRDGAARRRYFWAGCSCGRTRIALEPDGGVKGCANQVGPPFVVGNVRTHGLAELWADRPRWHWLDPPVERLAGACARCGLGRVCQAGCTALAFSATGHLFDNPYCLRTVRSAAESGEEEREP